MSEVEIATRAWEGDRLVLKPTPFASASVCCWRRNYGARFGVIKTFRKDRGCTRGLRQGSRAFDRRERILHMKMLASDQPKLRAKTLDGDDPLKKLEWKDGVMPRDKGMRRAIAHFKKYQAKTFKEEAKRFTGRKVYQVDPTVKSALRTRQAKQTKTARITTVNS